MSASPFTRRNAPQAVAGQRGVVLFIALIVMVAMSLAAVALIRSVDTTSQVIGNLAFRQASILPANLAIENAVRDLFSDAGGPRIPDIRVDTPARNYYASHNQAAGWDDQYGVPQPLQTKVAAQALTVQLPADNAGNSVTYVTERLCNPDVASPPRPADNKTDITWCDLISPKGGGCHTINEQCAFDIPPQAFYRVTVRVDGPQNTVSFVQAVLR
jgi:type IV pilus assembly protein PilX